MSHAIRDFLAALDQGAAPRADRVAEAMAQHLAAVRVDALPPAAQPVWREVAALLKADPAKPLPPRATSAIASWPGDRVARLIDAVRRIAAVLEKVENQRQEDEIRDQIRRHYL